MAAFIPTRRVASVRVNLGSSPDELRTLSSITASPTPRYRQLARTNRPKIIWAAITFLSPQPETQTSTAKQYCSKPHRAVKPACKIAAWSVRACL